MLGLFFAMTLLSAMQSPPADSRPIDSGVSQALARERVSAIQDLHYDLTFSIPGSRSEPIQGRAVVSLTLRAPSRLVFDFAQPRETVRRVTIDGSDPGADFVNGHIVIPATAAVGRIGAVLASYVGSGALTAGGPPYYFSAWAVAMTIVLVALAMVRRHIPKSAT